ncbi:MAG: GspE/PulE family protein [Planctomycetaceae bacterium]|jgi:type IV pilus assembly protein PilB|nr:GspE/PulE family protein [Planctomycetaceae bacterium]
MTSKQRIDLNKVVASRDALKSVPAVLARRLKILPLYIADEMLYVVMEDEQDDVALSQLESTLPMAVKALPALAPENVVPAIKRYYPDTAATFETPLTIFEEILRRALLYRCSDIHFDPEKENAKIRLRIDGVMRVDHTLPLSTCAEVVSAVKVAAGLDIAEHRIPQDGQMSINPYQRQQESEEISMRVAVIPTLHGEKLTIRILATEAISAELADLNKIGMSDGHHRLFMQALRHSYGIILLSGPTGSGKTTTLYAALRHLKAPGTQHILSIEDPVEIPLDGVNQIRIDSERVSFSKALRSSLRHDPDIIMLGEIRDSETADIAVKSSLTGHLVLSTLHANDAAGVTTRLLNLGIAAELMASALRIVVAQRLVRRPCLHCVQWGKASDKDKELFSFPSDARVPIPTGCPLCGGMGYAGRLGLYEMFPVDKRIREMIHSHAAESEIRSHAFEKLGLKTLQQDGADKILCGLTTPEEVKRVTFAM